MARQKELSKKWDELAPSFIRAKKALYAAKDHDDTFTAYIDNNELDEAANEVEEYSSCMLEAKSMFEEIRMMVDEINPEDKGLTVVESIMEKCETYLLLYKSLVSNLAKLKPSGKTD